MYYVCLSLSGFDSYGVIYFDTILQMGFKTLAGAFNQFAEFQKMKFLPTHGVEKYLHIEHGGNTLKVARVA